MTVDHVEVLVEEFSMEVLLRLLLPKLVGENVTFEVYPFQGKRDLLANLPPRLKGYSKWLPPSWRVVVVLDRDDADCNQLKNVLEGFAEDAKLTTKTKTRGSAWQVVNRLAIEELEAWFFGDLEAVRSVYPRIPNTLGNRAGYRDPDAIKGGTWEAFQRVLQRAGYFKGGMRKTEAARAIGSHMDPRRNRSRSFQVFRDAIVGMV